MNNQVANDLMCILEEIELNPDLVTNRMKRHCLSVVTYILSAEEKEVKEVEEILTACAEKSCWQIAVMLYSMEVKMSPTAENMQKFFYYIWRNFQKISLRAIVYLYGQCSATMFRNAQMQTMENKVLKWRLYERIVEHYVSFIGEPEWISEGERDSNFVLVITGQFLTFYHGPTKSALDRSRILIEKMGKKVLLINTAEGSCKENIMLCEYSIGGYVEEISNEDCVVWKGCRIPFFQCEDNMPDIDTIRILVDMVKKKKPSFALTIGDGGIVGAMISKMIPTLCVSMIPSDLIATGIKYQTLGRAICEQDLEMLKSVGRSEEDVVVGKFGSSLLEQKKSITRKEAGFAENGFLICTVGSRLLHELTDEFWEMAKEAVDQNTYFVLLGDYSDKKLDAVLERYPVLRGHIYAVGFVDDILCYMELCDLYVNPIRRGGGTSCVEAMIKKLPIVTTSFGDVAVNAGENFFTDSYETMPALIKKYREDKDFYKKQSEIALSRAEDLTENDGAFVEVVEEFLRRVR